MVGPMLVLHTMGEEVIALVQELDILHLGTHRAHQWGILLEDMVPHQDLVDHRPTACLPDLLQLGLILELPLK